MWPTLTKVMPWRPQGTDNLRWWRHMAQVPVVAIGGILDPEQVSAAAACGVDGVCVVRALGADPAQALPALERALGSGRAAAAEQPLPAWPHPTLMAAASIAADRGALSASCSNTSPSRAPTPGSTRT